MVAEAARGVRGCISTTGSSSSGLLSSEVGTVDLAWPVPLGDTATPELVSLIGIDGC